MGLAKKTPFRAWFYFRMGWSTYFAFIFSAINTLVVTYYLAIEKMPLLKEVFPSFAIYGIFMISIGVPLLVLFGYLHYKKSQAFTSEQDITYESSPYFFKLPKGHQRDVIAPYQLKILELMEKIITNENLSDKDKDQIQHLKKDLKTLIDGGSVGK
jgi:hypothetical protein